MKSYLCSANGKTFRMFDPESFKKIFVCFEHSTEVVFEVLDRDQVPAPEEMERRFIEMNHGAMEITADEFQAAFDRATEIFRKNL